MSFQKLFEQKIFRRVLIYNLIAPLALVITTGVVFTLLMFHLLSSSQLTDHTDLVMSQSNKVLRLIIDAETGLRGYLITGETSFLEPYDRATQTFDSAMTELKKEVQDSPLQVGRLDRVLGRYEMWLNYSHSAMKMKKNNRSYRGYVSLGSGKAIVDDIRREFDRLITEEEDLRVHREFATIESTRFTMRVVIFASLITILSIIFFGVRQLTILSRNYNQALTHLSESLNQIETTVNTLQLEKDIREKFINTLSHDLRTPLTAAKMSAQIIERKSSSADIVQNFASKIVGNIDRADQMIQDLLDANRIQAGQSLQPNIELIDLVSVVRKSLDDLITIYGDRFVLDAPKELSAYLCANGMRRIVENLCTNAIKYGHQNTPIRVIVADIGAEVSLGVHNFGDPLSDDDKNHLFHQFDRLSAAKTLGKEGWGIGLTIVKGITEAHGGKTEVESVSDGTIFRVILPKTT